MIEVATKSDNNPGFLGRATASRIDVCRPVVRNVLRECPTKMSNVGLVIFV